MKIIVIMMLFFCHSAVAQQYPGGKSILDKIDANMSSKSRIMVTTMEINSARGKRTMEMKIHAEGSEKAFTEYLAPAREKGTKMLKLDKQLWIFSPATDRVIQISGHMLRQSVMGSDLSYEDMMSDSPLEERYKADVTGEEMLGDRKCWIITLTALKEDVNYFKQQMWVDQERYIPLKVDMFAKSGKLLKRLEFSNVQKIQGRWFPMTMTYKDMLKEGRGTVMTFKEIQFDVKIPAIVFNKSALK
jgi:outer membrane lipoprotein-sorting protein